MWAQRYEQALRMQRCDGTRMHACRNVLLAFQRQWQERQIFPRAQRIPARSCPAIAFGKTPYQPLECRSISNAKNVFLGPLAVQTLLANAHVECAYGTGRTLSTARCKLMQECWSHLPGRVTTNGGLTHRPPIQRPPHTATRHVHTERQRQNCRLAASCRASCRISNAPLLDPRPHSP